ncbi:MAG: efflux RND transporter periplasmic adaptor subunit [Methylibium sp.]|uniref:efflux RND transporter periplasmic adaptor subunit n=1 Tax=Methylibium sp. TaxID=2067992 RepID=UPI0018483654|nr:efflux RND transporter periplasmic adaptor subunit [Methylibium sp.]MBA2722619.1 efflux RND transporter periplasmic adaptor subunit [Methylibium sp.]MBA3589129.1 efflux RND transporter periplasmic adaptor subunit [Methylibium sp.]
MKNNRNSTRLLVTVVLAAALAAGGYMLYSLGMNRGMDMNGTAAGAAGTSASAEPAADPTSSIAAGEAATRRHIEQGIKAGEVDPATGNPILYYHDPMVPGKRFDAPAKSPFMDMMLVPVYGGGGADEGTVTVSPRIQQNLGVRTAEVVEGVLQPQTSAVGSITWNERDQTVLQARAMGYVEKLHVRATLDRVAKGQPIAELYVPDWVAAQEEFLTLRNAAGADATLVSAARQRMRLAGMTEAQIAGVEQAGKVRPRLTLTAPSTGVVAELAMREGMTVAPGMPLARINGLSTVWAVAEVPEAQAALVQRGSKVEARSPGVPGEVFKGSVQAVLPEVDPRTRTVKARVELANPGFALSPGMFVTLQFMSTRQDKALLIPTEALIKTGRRSVVLLAEDGGRFSPVEVEAGIEYGGQTVVRSGLAAGQRVVVSSQFLIDSEASLRGVEARLNDAPASGGTGTTGATGATAGGAERHEGEALIEAIDRDGITLSHGPIPSIKWDSMTMVFKPPPAKDLPRGLSAGDRVGFEFRMAEEGPEITRLTLLPPASAAPGASGASR